MVCAPREEMEASLHLPAMEVRILGFSGIFLFFPRQNHASILPRSHQHLQPGQRAADEQMIWGFQTPRQTDTSPLLLQTHHN